MSSQGELGCWQPSFLDTGERPPLGSYLQESHLAPQQQCCPLTVALLCLTGCALPCARPELWVPVTSPGIVRPCSSHGSDTHVGMYLSPITQTAGSLFAFTILAFCCCLSHLNAGGKGCLLARRQNKVQVICGMRPACCSSQHGSVSILALTHRTSLVVRAEPRWVERQRCIVAAETFSELLMWEAASEDSAFVHWSDT